jgi:hypothetical protein
MKPEFAVKARLARVVFAVAAVSVTASIGGFVDYLATDYVAVVAELRYRPVQLAERNR